MCNDNKEIKYKFNENQNNKSITISLKKIN